MMCKLTAKIKALRASEEAVSATEYAVMLSFIVLVAFSGYFALGDKIAAILDRVSQIG